MDEDGGTGVSGLSVADLAEVRWGVRPQLAVARFGQPGWQYLREAEVYCPQCGMPLHAAVREAVPRTQIAIICPECPATFTTRQLKLSRRELLTDLPASPTSAPQTAAIAARQPATTRAASNTAPTERASSARATTRRPAPVPAAPSGASIGHTDSCSLPPGLHIRPATPATIQTLLSMTARQPPRRAGQGPVRTVAAHPAEHRLLYWCKTSNVAWRLPYLPPETDVRVVLPAEETFAPLRQRLTDAGIAHQAIAYWVEDETITSVGPRGALTALSVTANLARAGGLPAERGGTVSDQAAYDARDAFAQLWDAHQQAAVETDPPPTPVSDLLPPDWLDYLPFPTFNPAQAQAAPAILGTTGHLIVTAPTGAGKTVIGMLAALKAILAEGRKAAWLVPQRSLTDELHREVASWTRQGLRVEMLSGEYSTDIDALREADLWIATTEKFEAICRASSLQTALAEVGCLVVDEIHMLGATTRGPLLEALLARVRGTDSPVRIVGLSATVANAAELADWLEATLVTTTWRPSLLTWQLPMIPASGDRSTEVSLRTRVTVDLARRVTDGAGSVLVFCGSKRNVRATALALAADRGAQTGNVDPDDVDRVHEICAAVRIGVHYKGWEFRSEAEARFRAREWDVLVATSTVAAGVNLPARAVIVRDTQIGLDDIDVATVLQMFGRAGRIGAGERQGWAYLITSELERANWQGALVDGYTVYSQIHESLADHVLAEVLQGRIQTRADAEQWWIRTLSHHQGDDDLEPVTEALDFLLDQDYLTPATRPDDHDSDDSDVDGVAVTDLGRLTARLMVSTETGARLRAELAACPVPQDPDIAEDLLIRLLATRVPELAFAPIADPQRPTVATILKANGYRDRIQPATAVSGLGSAIAYTPGDLARAALLLVAHSPELFARPARAIAGLPSNTLFPILEQAPRYLAWLAAQGHLATIHPWVAIVAADLGRRTRWRRCAPHRGAGRLLWMCEQMATPALAADLVPKLWQQATGRGITAPDWHQTTPPRGCRLEPHDYTALLRDRTSRYELDQTGPDDITLRDAVAGTLVVWTGTATTTHTITDRFVTTFPPSVDDPANSPDRGAAVFTRRGDYKAVGWLAEHYHALPAPQ